MPDRSAHPHPTSPTGEPSSAPAATPDDGSADHPSPDAPTAPHQVPGARAPGDYTEPPGAHREAPDGPATDVGA